MGLLDRLRSGPPKRPARHHLSGATTRASEQDEEHAKALWEESAPDEDTVETMQQLVTTVQALRSLAVSHADAGDQTGARMLEDFAWKFAKHEITIV